MGGPGPASVALANAVLGRTIAGKFLIASYLGGGGAGVVFKARHLALDKDVAIKLMLGEHVGDAMFEARFEREAKAASKLDHPNWTRVIDFGVEPDGLAYIAMEYLDGRPLEEVLEDEWPLSPERMADIASQTLAAVAAANALGIVHRDLKPGNIMILHGTDDEGQARDVVKVCDFGIVKFLEDRGAPITDSARLTKHGLVVGTPEYMSPEQCRGEPLDVRSDLYSMGVILYQMLTGRVPFDAETALGIVVKHINEEAPAPRALNPEADERLEAICLKAMKKKREQRYQSAREMRTDLRHVVGTWAPEAPSHGSPTHDRPVLASVRPTQAGLGRPAAGGDRHTPFEPSVIVTPEPEMARPAELREAEGASVPPADPGPGRTRRMRIRDDLGPQGTQRMKAREPRGPTGTLLMKAREGRGPTGTVMLKARPGGHVPGRWPGWLLGAVVVGALVVLALAWALARA
jgi:serine/threonine protein kinase